MSQFLANLNSVIKDENHVATRCFFVYAGTGSANVNGNDVKLPKIEY